MQITEISADHTIVEHNQRKVSIYRSKIYAPGQWLVEPGVHTIAPLYIGDDKLDAIVAATEYVTRER